MSNRSNSNNANALAGFGPDVFRRLADTSADGIGMARLDSRILYANTTLRRMLELPDASELGGHSFYDYYPHAEAARLRDEIIPQVQATGTWIGELELISPSGAIWQTIQNIFLIRNEHGVPVAFANVITDLTERARVTASLRVSQAAIDSSINAIAMASLEGKLTYVNQAFIDLWRLESADDALGRSPLEFWEQPQQAQVVVEALQQVGHWQGEMQALRQDGSIATMQLSAYLVRNEAGQPLCMMSSFVDVSARIYAERELLRSEATLTSIVQHIPAMVFLKRASDLRFELLNPAGEQLLGLEQAALLGKSDHDIFLPEQAAAFVAGDQAVLASRQPLDIPEEAILARNGETRILHTRKVGIYDAAGEPIHLLGISLDITEQKRAEDALHEQREFAANLVDAAPVIVVLLDPYGGIQYVNPYFERLSGYRLADLKGREWFSSCLPVRDQDRVRAFFQQAMHETSTSGKVNPIVTRGGEEREIEWSNQTLHDADGNISALLGIGLDVTERRQIEERTRVSEARLNEAQHIAKVGSWELDIATGKLFWTDEIFSLFELDKAQFGASYDAFLNAIHPDDRDKVNAAYTQSLADREPYAITHRLRMSDDRIKWVEERCLTEFDADGKPLRSRGTVQDITERQQLEASLRNLNQALEQRVMERTAELEAQNVRNASIIQAAMDGFFIADVQGRVVDVNDMYCAMLGYDREALLSLTIPDIEANECSEDIAAHIASLLKQGRDRFDTRHRRKDGSLLDVEVNVTLVKLGGEQLFYAFVHDITPRKQAESALIESREEAERANAAKSEFLSRMSHELRTPLNAILGFGQLLETDPAQPLTATQLDNVREIRHAGDHLLDMVNEVLDLSRIESGRLEVNLEPVSVVSVIHACQAQIKPLAAQRGIDVALDLDAPCTVQADRKRLKEILLNLLSNAVKYNREGGSIRVACVAVHGGRLRISVRDSGHGIAPEALPRLFRPFERLESAYDGIEGTGIGLALSKKLVEAMHGEIGVDSVPGEGSTFWFELPLATGIEAFAVPDAIPAVAAVASGNGRRKVLYIEDNPANLRLVRKILSIRKDIELLDTGTAEAGLEIAANQRPDLILLDLNLPGMDGFEALRRLRDDPVTCAIPVIAVTANAMVRDIERGRAVGFSDYLTKPINVSHFLESIDRCLPGYTENKA